MSANVTILFENDARDDFDKKIVFYQNQKWESEAKAKLIESFNKVMQCLDSRIDTVKIEITIGSRESHIVLKKINTFLKGSNTIINTKLSLREVEVLEQILKGLTTQEIAQVLFISHDTVKTHRKHILLKTGMPNTPALINYYHRTLFDDK